MIELKFADCSHSRDPLVGCALEGVAAILAGIQGASIVIHSPQGCAATVGQAFDAHEIDFTRRKVACTRLFESDIVMGASQKLKDLIREADRTFGMSQIFVVGTCAADIIGENLEGICKELQPHVSGRLIPVFAGGFRGSYYDGANLGLDALLPFIEPNAPKVDRSVNLIAPQISANPNWFADLRWTKETLTRLGVRVQTVISHETPLESLKLAAGASANLLMTSDAGEAFAASLERQHGAPVIAGDLPAPVGLTNTARWLRAIGEYFEIKQPVEDLIREGEERVADILRRRALMIIPRYRNCRVGLCADATYAIGMLGMLFEELEMIPELVLVRSDSARARRLLDAELQRLGIAPKAAFGADGYMIKQASSQARLDALLGSSWETYIAQELGIKLSFDCFTPTNRVIYVDRPYFGYDGMLNLLEVIGGDWERALRSREIDADLLS